jgi:peptide/nickel transport system ATP-binding protein
MWIPSGTVPSGASPLLSVLGLTANYGYGQQYVPALCDVSFDLAPGEVVGVLGESGSGKRTLALSILGLLPSETRVEGSVSALLV